MGTAKASPSHACFHTQLLQCVVSLFAMSMLCTLLSMVALDNWRDYMLISALCEEQPPHCHPFIRRTQGLLNSQCILEKLVS